MSTKPDGEAVVNRVDLLGHPAQTYPGYDYDQATMQILAEQGAPIIGQIAKRPDRMNYVWETWQSECGNQYFYTWSKK